MDMGRVDPRVGSDLVGSRVSIKVNMVGRVGSKFLKCIIFSLSEELNNFTYCSEN